MTCCAGARLSRGGSVDEDDDVIADPAPLQYVTLSHWFGLYGDADLFLLLCVAGTKCLCVCGSPAGSSPLLHV